MKQSKYEELITFWRDVEALSPQTLPKLAPVDEEPVWQWRKGDLPRWEQTTFRKRAELKGCDWRNSVFSAIFEQQRFIEFIETIVGKPSGVFEARPGGKSCVFAFTVDKDGRPLAESLVLGMAAWSFGVIERGGLKALSSADIGNISDLHKPDVPLLITPSNSGFYGFDLLLDRLREEFAWRVGNLPAGEGIDDIWATDFALLVIEKCNLVKLFNEEDIEHRVKSIMVRRPKNNIDKEKNSTKVDDDLLNSFFIKDLNKLLKQKIIHVGNGYKDYLEPPSDLQCVDVRQEKGKALELLAPHNFPEGCWPAEYPLVWSQQVAINAMWLKLRGKGGIFAVNGPPGTGKTTLLRDLVAAIVVERSKILARLGESAFTSSKSIKIGKYTSSYNELSDELSGFSIVVASSNNGAVENVSLELPKKNAIHDKWYNSVDFFQDLAGEVLGQPAWGMVSGRLGNKSNRSDFVNTFWWQGWNRDAKVKGLRAHLEVLKSGGAMPSLSWGEAVSKFNSEIQSEYRLREKMSGIFEYPKKITELKSKSAEAEQHLADSIALLGVCSDQITSLNNHMSIAERQILLLQGQFSRFQEVRPGILDWISTLGRSHRDWRKNIKLVMDEMNLQERDRTASSGQLVVVRQQLLDIENKIKSTRNMLEKLQGQIIQTEKLFAEGKKWLGSFWPDIDALDVEQEKTTPWARTEWQEARIRVFLAALELHKSFVENNSLKIMENLDLSMNLLGNGLPDSMACKTAFDSLAIVCPVVSTTFASVNSLLGGMNAESIGWLLIDEAGQATPQAAAGAIWRSHRIVVVGDPLQLEPVVTLPVTVEAALAKYHGDVDKRWYPSDTSVQMLADQSTSVGTRIGQGMTALWVGAPLRVHRRCNKPMFTISNTIAYEGMMVHLKKKSTNTWPPSIWIDVSKGVGSDSNWLPAEGVALKELLSDLLNRHNVPRDDIFLISPFRDVVKQLKIIGKVFHLDLKNKVGTVHTTQGKEADIVILVLGGGTVKARDWVAEKPNLLNVAASRAKTRLYVIGDLTDWRKRRFFDVLAKETHGSAI